MRSYVDIAADLEKILVSNAAELLNGSVEKHTHWRLLGACTSWVQEQCRTTPSLAEDDALTTTLSSISSWLKLPRHTFYELRKKTYAQQRKAINEELSGNKQMIPFEIQSYAFTQHAMRELRAHTDNWADARKATAPSGLLGREGHEHMRTMASDMLERQNHWPFHLAGDSGARLFNHRAWISWRLLALLELPSLTLCELPSLSKDLQALIEVTRSNAQTSESFSAQTGQDIFG